MRTPPTTRRAPDRRLPAVQAEPPVDSPVHPQAATEEELIMHLEPDQFVVETSRRVPRAQLARGTVVALWGLRVFALTVSAMVIYTFVHQLH
jgi:hypothetical protein